MSVDVKIIITFSICSVACHILRDIFKITFTLPISSFFFLAFNPLIEKGGGLDAVVGAICGLWLYRKQV